MANDALIGKELGAYRIVAKIGEGGMSEVYKGRHVTLGHEVAIKVLSANLSQQGNARRRFIKEAKAVSKLRHPNIARVYHFNQEGGRYYMVMELVEGTTLRQRLDKLAVTRRRMSQEEVLQIISQLASALDYAHQQGMIHRDVKPSNILLTPDNTAVLTDFGIAKIIADTVQTTEGAILGTPTYMAPEQATSKRVRPQSDVYSLGIVLYELVTGKVPFESDTTLSTILQHMREPPPPPSRYNKGLKPAVEQVILKALEKAPQDRFACAGEMAQALEEAWQETPARPERRPARRPAARTTPRKRGVERKWSSPATINRLLAGALGAILALFIYVLVGSGLLPIQTTAARSVLGGPTPTPTRPAEEFCFIAELEKYVEISGNMMQLEGRIRDRRGNPLPGVPIRMSRPEWSYESAAWGSRQEGYYLVDGLVQAGVWRMDLPNKKSKPFDVELIPNKKAVVNWQEKPCQ
jgi:tRNA A-37 threonylcarbamoyl transferase component Bud32